MAARVRRHAPLACVLLLLAGGFGYARAATGGPVIPVPNPLVKVTTISGDVVRTRTIPLGGVPVPIDVDEHVLLGLLYPDVDVSAGLIAAEELPGKPLVPNITINRDPTAVVRKAPAPPLRIDMEIQLKDAGNGLKDLADITYGYQTPSGGRAPTTFKSKLIGPVSGGFVDPLEAVVETPGYSAPLKVNAHVITDSFDGTFGVQANPIPERIHFIEDPRPDGLDFYYDHQGPIPDIKLDATADLRNRSDNRLRHVDAHVERLPQALELHNTNTSTETQLSYKSTTTLAKPDLEANYRDTLGNGTVVTDANVKVSGLPAAMTGDLKYVPDGKGGSDVDSFDFNVLGNDQIDALDFLARNWIGDPGPIPEPALGPDQFVAAATRQMPDASTRFRAAGRLLGVRSLHLERQGSDNQQVDVRTDMGDGTVPLRAIVDLDNRGPGGPTDPKLRQRMKVDTTVTPLPRTIHVNYDPARDGVPSTHLSYDSPSSVDVDTTALIANDDHSNGCGDIKVTCLTARIDKLPSHLEATLPGQTGTDFSLSNNATDGNRPDVRATIDRTSDNASDRTYANVALLRVPNQVRGRVDISGKDVVRAAEFHACDWNFDTAKCRDTQSALGRVSFTIRDQPKRVGLPPRPDTTQDFVTLLSRDPTFGVDGDEHLEVTGRVDEVRNVAFRQRDLDNDGKADGTLGVQVDVGSEKTPFDAIVDTGGFEADPDHATVDLGPTSSKVKVNVDELPTSFSACVREQADTTPPDPTTLPADALLSDCDRTDVLGHAAGTLDSTPMSVAYHASTATKVTANVSTQSPDIKDDDRQAVTELHAVVDKIPHQLRTDVIPPVTPDAANGIADRKLEFAYNADDNDPSTDDTVGSIAFNLASRRANSLCEDPRVNRKAVCVSGLLKDLPKSVNATYDPDISKGDVTIDAAPPESGHSKLSINPGGKIDEGPPPFRLSSVSPDSDPIVLDARIEGIGSELRGKLQQVNLDPEDKSMTGPLAARIATCSDTDSSGNPIDNDGIDGANALDPDCAPDMARFAFDACPGVAPKDLPSCDGVGKLTFKATNALVGDPLDPVPPGPSGVTQDFSFVQNGDDFRAEGTINKFKQVALDKLDAHDQPSETTKLRAAFGNGDASDKIRAYVNRDTGTEAQKVDAVIAQAPQAVNLCLRSAIDPADLRSGPDYGFCETAPADKTAIETSLDTPASTEKPDITVSDFELSKGGGAEVLRGIPGPDPAIEIDDLAQKVQVLAGAEDKTTGKRSDLLVEGKTLDDQLDNVAGRVSFALQNFNGSFGSGFPAQSLGGTTDPQDDDDNLDPSNKPNAGRNFLKMIKKGDALQLRGSVPAIKRIRMAPEPCHPEDPRFPAEAGFDPAFRPEYTCINALAGAGRPLGLAVRTLDAKGQVLAIDEGNLDTVPGGATGLEATLTKSPDAAKTNKVCASDGSPEATAAGGCRPPFISLEAPRDPGQVPHFRARIATGPLDLLESLRNKGPIDVLSQRLNFEQSPKSWGSDTGARLKLGTRGDETALRGSFKLEIPKFLDLDPPTAYSCKHLTENDVGDCDATDVSAEAHQGFEAKDIFIKLVGSNTGHGDRDLATLGPNGRLALLVHDFETDKQTILTGTPDADGNDGSTSYNGENLPPAGDADRGLVIPGYMDARVWLRDDYTAADDDDKEQKFIQVDGRVNNPLSLALRLNEPDEHNRYGENRNHDTVPGKQFTLRNAPCAGLPACGPYQSDTFDNPSFRIRAEVRAQRPKPKDDRCQGPDAWGAGFGFTACIILPQPDVRWMNVDLNQHPDPGDPAREIDAVADTKDGNYDLRAFRNINDPDKFSHTADFTPQAALRLDPFEVGFKAGVGIGIVGAKTEMSMTSDLIADATGHANRQLRLSQDGLAIRLKSEGGKSTVATDLHGHFHTEVTEEAVFGLFSDTQSHDTPDDHIHSLFEECPGFQFPDFLISHDAMSVTNGSDKAAVQLIPNVDQADPAAVVITGVNAFLVPIWCVLPNTEDNDMVTSQYPAPRWDEPGRGIDNIGKQPGVGGSTSTDLGNTAPAKQDITVDNGTTTMCGTVSAKTLHVTSTGSLRVGAEGTTIPGPPPTNTTIACDGRLFLDVDNLVVDAGGQINAGDARTTAGPGQPGSGLGGGAGHGAGGGASGSGGGGGGGYGDDTHLTDQFGSRGRGGTSASGGLGGGVLRVDASDSISVAGTVRANGGSGTGVGDSDCGHTSSGGGSGGAIQLTANKVNVSGLVQADGGPGGSGANGGGGGAGGRVRIDTVIENVGGTVRARGGGKGFKSGSCNDGADGGDGPGTLGTELERAAGVTRNGTGPWVQGSVSLHLKGVQKGGGSLDIVYCKASVPLGTNNPFDDPGINPPSVSDTSDLDGGDCRTDHFDNPTSGGDTYDDNVTWSGLSDAYYGFYAFAKHHHDIFFDDYQPIAPTVSTVKVGSDSTPPDITDITRRNGVDGCADDAFCLDSTTGRMRLAADDGHGSGIVDGRCSINGGSFSQNCLPADNVSVNLGGDGARTVDVRLTDAAGNQALATDTSKQAKWFVDVTPPEAPVITLVQHGDFHNGWWTKKPTLVVSAHDPGASAGWGEGPIAVTVDEANRTCPTGAPSGATAVCGDPDTSSFVPDNGVHSFTAQATDKLNHEGPKTATCDGSTGDPTKSCTMQTDSKPPKSRLYVGPTAPDGDNGWYVTRPFFAFAASDGAGGSGVDLTLAPSAIRFRIDNGPWQSYDPALDDDSDPTNDNQLPEGTHRICYYAIDIAGNHESDVEDGGNLAPPNCSDPIHVDTTPPAVSAPATPTTPNGDNAFYVTTPTVSPGGAEITPSGVNDTSGLAKVEYQLDDGAWTAAAPFTVPEGTHDIRARAFDKAGNAAPLIEQTINVDKSKPASKIVSFPPRPDDQGYFRQDIAESVSAHDGRDGSGADGATWQVDGGPLVSYLKPFYVGHGAHTVSVQARDFAGLKGDANVQTPKVDTVPPVPTVVTPDPVYVAALGNATLRYSVTDSLTPKVKVRIVIYDVLGNVQRTITVPGSSASDPYVATGPGSVVWDGKTDAGKGVLPGAYHYRVQATDQAGNTAISSESAEFVIVFAGLPRLADGLHGPARVVLPKPTLRVVKRTTHVGDLGRLAIAHAGARSAVVIQARGAHGAWRRVARVTASARGTATVQVRPRARTRYRAVTQGGTSGTVVLRAARLRKPHRAPSGYGVTLTSST